MNIYHKNDIPIYLQKYFKPVNQVGIESTPEEYVERMTKIFSEVKRVLKDDGTLWLNLGDTYWGGDCGESMTMGTGKHPIYKPKDLIGVPWLVAFALQKDGWWLRQDIIWSKNSCLPECLDFDTQIFVRKNGWVSRIVIGQLLQFSELPEILSPTGWVKINKVWKTEKKQAIRIEASKVENIICSNKHRFPISSDRRQEKIRYEEAQNIRHEGCADYFLYCPISKFLKSNIIKSWLGIDLSYDIGFLVGAYAAEGGKHGERGFGIKLTINCNEHSFADKIEKGMLLFGKIATRFTRDNYMNICTNDERIVRFMESFVFGICKTKALNIELILNCDENFRKGILEGYIEGDGSQRNSGWGASSASRRLRDDIATLASSVGIITSKGTYEYFDKRTNKTYRHHGIWTPYVNKRKEKAGMDGVYQVAPRRRKKVEDREMIDIEVEGGVFLIGDGLITHNSVKDRCTKSHEYIFLLSKSDRYYYNAEAIKEPCTSYSSNDKSGQSQINRLPGIVRERVLDYDCKAKAMGKIKNLQPDGQEPNSFHLSRAEGKKDKVYEFKNKRSVWTINSEPFKESHFAVFPTEIPRLCILAGSKPNDVVLDPFSGSGTTGAVANELQRDYIGIELNPNYAKMRQKARGVSPEQVNLGKFFS